MAESLQSADSKKQMIYSFTRIEDKFILPVCLLGRFQDLVRQHLIPSHGTNTADSTLVQSLYFDSAQLDFFQHHFQRQLKKRFKLRVRRYAPNGVWAQGLSFLEAKCKSDGVSSKQRFLITEKQYEQLMAGAPMAADFEFFASNAQIDEATLLARLEEMNNLIATFSAKPQMSIEYRRLAFEKNDLRITIDQGLNVRALRTVSAEKAGELMHAALWKTASRMKHTFQNGRDCIIEVKHSGLRPAWFDQFNSAHDINQTSFSKYCWGVAQTIDAALDQSPRLRVPVCSGGLTS